MGENWVHGRRIKYENRCNKHFRFPQSFFNSYFYLASLKIFRSYITPSFSRCQFSYYGIARLQENWQLKNYFSLHRSKLKSFETASMSSSVRYISAESLQMSKWNREPKILWRLTRIFDKYASILTQFSSNVILNYVIFNPCNENGTSKSTTIWRSTSRWV